MKNPVEHLFSMFDGQRIPALRVLRGPYSQKELAAWCKVYPSTIDDWEHGRVLPQPRHLRRLLEHAAKWTGDLGLKLTDVLELATENRKEKTP